MVEKLPQLTDDHHYAIANVAVRSAQMEVQIENTIEVALRNQPKTAEFALKNLGTDRVVGFLEALLMDSRPSDAMETGNLIAKIRALRIKRNETLHWFWIKGDAPDTATAATKRPFREFSFREQTAEEVQTTADEMRTVVHALLWWQDDLRK